MNRISGYSDMLAEISENAEEREYAAIIKKDTERLLKLITDIIELAQLASEDIQPDFSEITVKDFFRRIRAHHTPEFPQQIAFRVIIPQELEGQKIYTDTGRLQKVFGHLIGNALKFTKEGYVELAAGRNKDNFTFTVADSGAGIDGDKLDFIFDYFRQVDGSSTRSAGGVGAGLTLVKHLTEILGGSVYVTSTKGKGTTVSLTFPWRALQKESLKQKQVAHHNKSTDMPWQGKHIVVLDDRLSNVEFINAALKKTGVTISRKHSAEELLKDLPEGAKTDLVIINNKDYKVSEEQTAQIKASNYTLPVIMLTAATADFSPLEAVADEVLTLPVSYKVLLERISKVFNNNRH
jgi:nitrogen-specific signal transduction histidine kinase